MSGCQRPSANRSVKPQISPMNLAIPAKINPNWLATRKAKAMDNETVINIQARLPGLTLALPELRTTAQWAEILAELEGLSQRTQRQEALLETVAAISDTASSIL